MNINKIKTTIILFIMYMIIYLYKCIKRKYYNNYSNNRCLVVESSNKLKENKNSSQFVSHNIVNETMAHKEMLLKLHEATDKCYMKVYALRCIHLVNYCPHLINIPHGSDGYTPFHRVCYNGNLCLIEYMLAKGANPFLTTYTGENAICMALYYFLQNRNKIDFTCLDMLYETGCHLDKHYDIFIKAALSTNNKPLAEWILLHSKVIKPLRSHSEPLNSMYYTYRYY